jgi:hypothetical protein
MVGISLELVYCLIKNMIVRRFGGSFCHCLKISAACPVVGGGGDELGLKVSYVQLQKFKDSFRQARLAADCL